MTDDEVLNLVANLNGVYRRPRILPRRMTLTQRRSLKNLPVPSEGQLKRLVRDGRLRGGRTITSHGWHDADGRNTSSHFDHVTLEVWSW